MIVAIRIGDNDFWSTYEGVLRILLDAHRWGTLDLTDKKRVIEMINLLVQPCYLLFQGVGDHTEYLSVTEDSMLWSYEDIQQIDKLYGFNGDVHVLDTDLDFDGNNPVYTC